MAASRNDDATKKLTQSMGPLFLEVGVGMGS